MWVEANYAFGDVCSTVVAAFCYFAFALSFYAHLRLKFWIWRQGPRKLKVSVKIFDLMCPQDCEIVITAICDKIACFYYGQMSTPSMNK